MATHNRTACFLSCYAKTWPMPLQRMSQDQDALELVFKTKAWDKMRADLLSPGVDLVVTDMAYEAGAPAALELWQRGSYSYSSDAMRTIHRFTEQRLGFLQSIKTLGFLNPGWLLRVANVETEAVEMFQRAAGPQASADSRAAQSLSAASDAVAAKASSRSMRAWGFGVAGVAATLAAFPEHPYVAGALALLGVFLSLHQAWGSHANAVRRDTMGDAADRHTWAVGPHKGA